MNIDTLLKERARALAVQVPAPWLQLSVLFWKAGSWTYPLAPNVALEHVLENRISRMGALRVGPLAASLGDLGQAHPLPTGCFLPFLSFILRVQPATSFVVNVLAFGEMMGMGDAGCFFFFNVMSFLGKVEHRQCCASYFFEVVVKFAMR